MTMIGSLMMMVATATTPADLLDRLVQRVRSTGPIEHAEFVAHVPRGRSLDEETHFTRDEAEGVLSFGFAGKAPDCLSSVTFEGGRVADVS